MSSAICFNLDQSKILLSVNWLNLCHNKKTLQHNKFVVQSGGQATGNFVLGPQDSPQP